MVCSDLNNTASYDLGYRFAGSSLISRYLFLLLRLYFMFFFSFSSFFFFFWGKDSRDQRRTGKLVAVHSFKELKRISTERRKVRSERNASRKRKESENARKKERVKRRGVTHPFGCFLFSFLFDKSKFQSIEYLEYLKKQNKTKQNIGKERNLKKREWAGEETEIKEKCEM